MASEGHAEPVQPDEPASPTTQLRNAAMQGNLSVLSQLLAQHPGFVDGAPSSAGQAPLLVAALLGQKQVVEALLSAGGNPNIRGRRQETALMLAAQRGHVEVIRTLLARGAHATMVDQRGWTALHFGAFAGHVGAVRALLTSAVLPRSSILEVRTAKGETALALAAFGRKDECIRALIKAGSRPALVADAGDRQYAVNLVAASAADGAGGGAGGRGLSTLNPPVQKRPGAAGKRQLDVAGGGQQVPGESPGPSPGARPQMQFSGTPSEFERLITPQHSEAAAGSGKQHGRARSGSPGRFGVSPRPDQGVASPRTDAGGASWSLHELDYRGTPLLQHRPTGLLFTSVPEDRFPHLVGLLTDGKARWLGEGDLQLLESQAQVCEALAATVPVGRLLLKRLNVVPEPVLRLCTLLGLHEMSELRELVLVDPSSPQYQTAWQPAALPPGHLAQLRPLLRAELLRPPANSGALLSDSGSYPEDPDSPSGGGGGGGRAGGKSGGGGAGGAGAGPVVGPEDDSVAAAGPLPVELLGPALIQHLLERYGLAKLMIQVAELEITAPPDLLVLAHPGSWKSAGNLSSWEAGRLARMLRDLPGLLAAHAKARERAETEAALGPTIEAIMRERRLEALARPSRGCLVTFDDLDTALVAGRRKASRVAVVLQDDTAGGADGDAAGRFVVRDLETDRVHHMLAGHIKRVRASDAAKLLRQDYAPPVSAGVPVTPLSAAPGLLVTRGSAWGRGPAYDVYGEGIVGELLGPEDPPEGQEGEEQAGGEGGEDEQVPYKSYPVAPGKSPWEEGGANGPLRASASVVVASAAEPAGGRRRAAYAGRWRVLWPDGQVHSYSVGQNGQFELSFLGLHWRSGAPVLDSHRGLLVAPGEVAVIPVARGPVWAEGPDDGLPGSPGAALLDRTTPGLVVDWLRNLHRPVAYHPDPAASGAYPVVHAMVAGQPVTLFTARQGARVEPAGLYPQAMSGGSGLSATHFYHKYYQSWKAAAHETVGPGILLSPLRLEKDGLVVVWLVSWPHAGRQEARVGATPGTCDLVFAPLADCPQAKNRLPHEHWHSQSAEGRLVRLNPAQLGLQPSAAGGPLRPNGRDVGVVVRDLGPGVHCGLLVRQLAGATSYWYDEDVLLPLTGVEVRRLPPPLAAALAVGAAAVPVMDCTAMPGMLVRRCYDDGSSLKCSEKEQQVGLLIAPVGTGRWLVRWSDGASAVYNTGTGGKFQLSYICEHPQAGAPLAMPRSLDHQVLAEAAVVPGFDCGTPFAADAGDCDLVVVGGALVQVPEEDKPRLLARERMPLTVGPGAKQFRYSAGGLFRIFELAHAAVPGQPVTVFTAKQGLRVVLQSADRSVVGASSGGGAVAAATSSGGAGGGSGSGDDEPAPPPAPAGPPVPTGTMTRPIRLGPKGVRSGSPSARRGNNRVRRPQSPYSPRAPGTDTADAAAEANGEVDSSTALWEVVWDNGTVSSYLVGLSPAVTALRVAPQPGFKTPAPAAPREPPEQRLAIHDPVLILPLQSFPVLDDHISSLASNLDTAVCALNATAQRLASLWISAATCEPVAPYRVVVQRVPMHGDSLLLEVGPAKGPRGGDGPVGHLDPEEAQDLLRAIGREDGELAAAAAALEAALRGAPHLDLEVQRAAEKAALERQREREAAGSRGPTDDGGGHLGGADGSGGAAAVQDYGGRWILTGMSYEDASADAAVSLEVVMSSGGGGGDGGDGEPVVQVLPRSNCSGAVAAALQRFNGTLQAAQAALDNASGGALRYQVTVLPRPLGAVMPLSHLQLGQSKPDPLLVQELLETFHSFTLGIVEAAAADGGGGGGAGDAGATPLGPLALAALNVGPEVRAAISRAHEAMSEYVGSQAAVWRRQIREMYDKAEAAAGGKAAGQDKDAGSDAGDEGVGGQSGLDATKRGLYNGLAIEAWSPPMLSAQGGVRLGETEGLIEASEEATGLTPSEVAARFNDALLQLWRAASRGNRCGGGGGANVAEPVVKVYSYMHEQVAKAVAAFGITFMGQDAGNMRREALDAAKQAAAAVEELRGVSIHTVGGGGGDGEDEEGGGGGGGGGGLAAVVERVKEGVVKVRRLVHNAASLAADVANAASEAAAAADEQSKKGLAGSSEELLQDVTAAAAVVTTARWAAAATEGTAAAAKAAADAAAAVASIASEVAEEAGAGGMPAVHAAVAAAAALTTLARKTAAAAKEQKESSVALMQQRLEGAQVVSKALAARVLELARQVAEAEAAVASGGGSEQALAKARADYDTAKECATKAQKALVTAAEVRDKGMDESDAADGLVEEAVERAAEASSEAAGVAAAAATVLEAAALDAGVREPATALALLTQAATVLDFAAKVDSSAAPPSAYESLMSQAAELCSNVANTLDHAALELNNVPKGDPDRISPKQRNLSSAAALLRQLHAFATSRPALSLSATATAGLNRAANTAGKVCSDVVKEAQTFAAEGLNKARGIGGEVAARVHYEILELRGALEDLAVVAAGTSDMGKVNSALNELDRILTDNDNDLVKLDKYNREHPTWRQVAVAVTLQSLSVNLKRLPQTLESAAAALDKAIASGGGGGGGGGGAATPSGGGAESVADGGDDAPATPTGGGGGGGGGEDAGRALAGHEKAFQGVAEAERELRRAVRVGRALMQRSWFLPGAPGSAELREAEEVRGRWAQSAASALAGAAAALCGAMTSRAVQNAGQLSKLNSAVEAVEGALGLLQQECGLPSNSEAAAAVGVQLRMVQGQREGALEEAAVAFGGVAAVARAKYDPVGALLAAGQPGDEEGGGGGGGGGEDGEGGGSPGGGPGGPGGPRGRGGSNGVEIVFRPVFELLARGQGQAQSEIQFHVNVLLKEPGRRAAPPPPEVSAVLDRPAIRSLMEPLEQLIDVANNILSNAHRALRDMVSEADLLAPLLGLTSGTALLRTSRDGPAGLLVGAGRYGPHVEALVRANLRQAARHSHVQQSYRALLDGLVEGLQDAAAQLSEVLQSVPVPYHSRRAALEIAARNEELLRQTLDRAAQEADAARARDAEEAAAARAAKAAAAEAARAAEAAAGSETDSLLASGSDLDATPTSPRAPVPPPRAAGASGSGGTSPRASRGSFRSSRRTDQSAASGGRGDDGSSDGGGGGGDGGTTTLRLSGGSNLTVSLSKKVMAAYGNVQDASSLFEQSAELPAAAEAEEPVPQPRGTAAPSESEDAGFTAATLMDPSMLEASTMQEGEGDAVGSEYGSNKALRARAKSSASELSIGA